MNRSKKVAELRKYHETYFNTAGIENAYFDSKAVSFIDNTAYIGFFESQLTKGDIYFEINGYKQDIIDSNRTLYRLCQNKNFKSDNNYRYEPDNPSGIPQYYIKKDSHLIEVINKDVYFRKENLIDIPLDSVQQEDCNFNEMTLRDYTCIHLRVPESNKQWLNELIKKHG